MQKYETEVLTATYLWLKRGLRPQPRKERSWSEGAKLDGKERAVCYPNEDRKYGLPTTMNKL